MASLAAAFLPDLAPLAAQAAVPGVALVVLAAALRFIIDRRTTAAPAARIPVPAVSASSMTQVAPQPSVIIAPSSPPLREGSTNAARDLP